MSLTNTTLRHSGISLFFLFLPFMHQSTGQVKTVPKPFDLCETSNLAFKSGEELTYTVYYNWNFVWLSAGEVVFKVEELPNAYKITAKGRTFPSYEWFFKVRDYYEAIIDKNTLLPLKTIRDIKEGGYRLYEKVEYHEGGYTVTSHRGRESKKLESKEFMLSGCAHDVLSSFYFARNQPFDGLKKGATLPVRVFLDREEYNLRIKYLGKMHKVEVKDQGSFRAIGLSPETVAGTVFSEGAVMTIYASDDANRIPLMIESPVTVGSIKAVLKSHKNLRYPLSSRLKS